MIISPSVLSFNYANFKHDLDILNKNVEYLHFDVMDGHFVPNLTFGPDILKQFRQNSNLFIDAHLMVDNPVRFTEAFAKAGADGITFHYEVFNNIEECRKMIKFIKAFYIKAGISIKPNTDVSVIEPLLKDIDLVLVMSVEPGFGGQEFIPNSIGKIRYLDGYRKTNKLNYLIEVDGGINDKTAYEVLNAGCDILVAGSYIFKGDIEKNINSLRKCA